MDVFDEDENEDDGTTKFCDLLIFKEPKSFKNEWLELESDRMIIMFDWAELEDPRPSDISKRNFDRLEITDYLSEISELVVGVTSVQENCFEVISPYPMKLIEKLESMLKKDDGATVYMLREDAIHKRYLYSPEDDEP